MPSERVKVLFRLEKDADGYPPVEVESLWGIVRSDGIELDSIPFYAKGVALGDLVKAMPAGDGALEFEGIVRRGGHSTYRVLLLGEAEVRARAVMDELTALGLGVEQDVACLLAVDVPPDVHIDLVRQYFIDGRESGRWEVQEGHRATE